MVSTVSEPHALAAADLLRLLADEGSVPDVSETLLNQLAETAAASPHDKAETALATLKSALAEAELLKTLGTLTQDSTDAVTTLLRRVATLNDQGQRDQAGAEIDAAIKALPPGQTTAKAALTEIALRQDRIRHAPGDSAKRLLADLRAVAHPGGLFKAIHAVWESWFDQGAEAGLTFDLTTALHLARANLERAKGVLHTQALGDLGITQFRLGEKEGRPARLAQSVATFREFLTRYPRKNDPENWAVAKVNLGTALSSLGLTETGTARLDEAATAFRAALEVQTRARAPLDWADTSASLAATLTEIADRTGDAALARQALEQLQEAEGLLPTAAPGSAPPSSGDRLSRAQAVVDRLA